MLKQLQNELKNLKLDSFLVSSAINIFYLTGYNNFSDKEREAVILISKKNNYLLTDGRYFEEIKNINNFIPVEISSTKSMSEALLKLVNDNHLSFTGFEENNLTVNEYKTIKKSFFGFKPTNNLIENLRKIKTKQEIKYIKLACSIGDEVFKKIIKELTIGITEIEIGKKLEIFIKQQNANISFEPIVAFGKNSAIPHHRNSNLKLKSNSIVLLDFGVNYNGYCSDMTRTVFFGSPPEKFKKMYETVLEAQIKAVEYINSQLSMVNSKLTAAEVDKVARQYITKEGFESIPHSLGHGIGIEVHENPSLSPKSTHILKTGMVFSIEPGIYISNYGGVRIEDLYLFNENKLKKITHSTSRIISL